MIANFFSNLSEAGTEYLLISGQAAVLHGAAFFSEDIDLWVSPTEGNFESLQRALQKSGALYYKLTPPLTAEFIDRGHGFHFQLRNEDPAWLDVMGVPPRTSDFASAQSSAIQMETEWGRLPVVSIPHLIEIKKTQRLEDYPVISNLVLNHLRHLAESGESEYRWALENIFTWESFEILLAEYPDCQSTFPNQENLTEEKQIIRMQENMRQLQKEDRDYWRERITELKALRSEGRLMPVNEPV